MDEALLTHEWLCAHTQGEKDTSDDPTAHVIGGCLYCAMAPPAQEDYLLLSIRKSVEADSIRGIQPVMVVRFRDQ